MALPVVTPGSNQAVEANLKAGVNIELELTILKGGLEHQFATLWHQGAELIWGKLSKPSNTETLSWRKKGETGTHPTLVDSKSARIEGCSCIRGQRRKSHLWRPHFSRSRHDAARLEQAEHVLFLHIPGIWCNNWAEPKNATIVSIFLTLRANLQHSELDCPVFQFQSTCISWLTKVKVTSLQSKEQTSMLLSGQKPPCKPTGWCYSKGCCAQFSSYLSNAASEIYKCFSSDIEFAFVSSNHEICKRKKNSKWQHTNELGYKRDVGLAVGLGTGNPSCWSKMNVCLWSMCTVNRVIIAYLKAGYLLSSSGFVTTWL